MKSILFCLCLIGCVGEPFETGEVSTVQNEFIDSGISYADSSHIEETVTTVTTVTHNPDAGTIDSGEMKDALLDVMPLYYKVATCASPTYENPPTNAICILDPSMIYDSNITYGKVVIGNSCMISANPKINPCAPIPVY